MTRQHPDDPSTSETSGPTGREGPIPGDPVRARDTGTGTASVADPASNGVSVIICAYTFDRLVDTIASARSALEQIPRPGQVVVVVDHDRDLLECLRSELSPEVEVVPSTGPKGLSGARNTGIARARGSIVAFLDDDATARPGWLAGIVAAFEDPDVLVAGGHAEPAWDGMAPGWFPPEFLWVVGCSYEGMRRHGPVRNVLGSNMAVRGSLFETLGGFDPAVGRSATVPLGGDETELCIRARREHPGAKVVLVEGSVVSHRVPAGRKRLGYFVRRCYYEGISKAALRRLEGSAALESEWRYTLRTLPEAVLRSLLRAARGNRPAANMGQALAVVLGLATTSAGFAVGSIRSRVGADSPILHSGSAASAARGLATDVNREAAIAPDGRVRRRIRPRVVRATPVVVGEVVEAPGAVSSRGDASAADPAAPVPLVHGAPRIVRPARIAVVAAIESRQGDGEGAGGGDPEPSVVAGADSARGMTHPEAGRRDRR